MSALAIGGLGLLALCLLILLQVPIGIAMIVVGIAGYALQSGWGPAMTVLAGWRRSARLGGVGPNHFCVDPQGLRDTLHAILCSRTGMIRKVTRYPAPVLRVILL